MAYNPAIPQAGNLISNSQAQILENFSQLNTQFSVDHVAFNSGSNNGNHKQVTIPTPLTDDPTLSSTTGEYYTKQVSSVTYPFFANASTVWQLAGQKSTTTNGYTTLPGGFLIQWGNYQITNGNSSNTVTFPTTFTALYAVVAFPVNVAYPNVQQNAGGASASSTTGFTAQRSTTSGTATYNYFAIGI